MTAKWPRVKQSNSGLHNLGHTYQLIGETSDFTVWLQFGLVQTENSLRHSLSKRLS